VALHQAPQAGFKRFGWQMEDVAQLDLLADRLAKHGLVPAEVESAPP
jgi:hypothetical protein